MDGKLYTKLHTYCHLIEAMHVSEGIMLNVLHDIIVGNSVHIFAPKGCKNIEFRTEKMTPFTSKMCTQVFA